MSLKVALDAMLFDFLQAEGLLEWAKTADVVSVSEKYITKHQCLPCTPAQFFETLWMYQCITTSIREQLSAARRALKQAHKDVEFDPAAYDRAKQRVQEFKVKLAREKRDKQFAKFDAWL